MLEQRDVDILTPVYGSPDLLRMLVETIFSIDAGNVTWRWWVIDDKGPQSDTLDEVYRQIRLHKNGKVIPPTVNRGFAGANNEAFLQGVAPYVLLLNSDTKIIEPGWLEELVWEATPEDVGVVGAKLLFFEDSKDPKRPAGTTQHAGVAFNVLGQPYHIFKGWDRYHPKVDMRREMNCVTGACLMTKRALYRKLGGLDIDYTTGNFEDVQYCLQVRADNKKVIYTPRVNLYHFAGGSDNTKTARMNESIYQLKCAKIIEWDDWKYNDHRHSKVFMPPEQPRGNDASSRIIDNNG